MPERKCKGRTFKRCGLFVDEALIFGSETQASKGHNACAILYSVELMKEVRG